MENFIIYQHKDAKFKKIIAKKKKLGWYKFCESLNPCSPSTIVWNNVKRFRRSLNAPQSLPDGPSQWLNDFANKLSPPFVPHHDSFPKYIPTHISGEMEAPFSFDELSTVLSDLKDSSPGEDGVPYSFIGNLNVESKIYF